MCHDGRVNTVPAAASRKVSAFFSSPLTPLISGAPVNRDSVVTAMKPVQVQRSGMSRLSVSVSRNVSRSISHVELTDAAVMFPDIA